MPLKEYAVTQLLELKNDGWLGEGEEPLSPEQIMGLMNLESLSVCPDGTVFFFFYPDGDMSLGHCILIAMDGADQFTDADIPG